MPSPSVACIVLNYNGRELTLDTVASLLAMDYPDFRVAVVDNGSTDGSHDAIRAAHPEVVVLRVEENRGISPGLNKGITWALARTFDYLLLLNNDIEVDAHMLTELVRVAESDPSIGCVGPKTYYWADRQRLWSAGGIIRFRESVTRERGMRELDRGQYERDQEVPYVNGCAMLVRRRAQEDTGLFDPVYHVGVEDADWCMRMKQRGYRPYYAHRALLWHRVSPTLGGYKPGRTFLTGRASALFVRRFASPWQRLTFFLFLGLAIPVAFLRELPRGNQAAALAKLRGVLEGWREELPPPPGPFADPASRSGDPGGGTADDRAESSPATPAAGARPPGAARWPPR
jgi:GT2 family glycosyltransferase